MISGQSIIGAFSVVDYAFFLYWNIVRSLSQAKAGLVHHRTVRVLKLVAIQEVVDILNLVN